MEYKREGYYPLHAYRVDGVTMQRVDDYIEVMKQDNPDFKVEQYDAVRKLVQIGLAAVFGPDWRIDSRCPVLAPKKAPKQLPAKQVVIEAEVEEPEPESNKPTKGKKKTHPHALTCHCRACCLMRINGPYQPEQKPVEPAVAQEKAARKMTKTTKELPPLVKVEDDGHVHLEHPQDPARTKCGKPRLGLRVGRRISMITCSDCTL